MCPDVLLVEGIAIITADLNGKPSTLSVSEAEKKGLHQMGRKGLKQSPNVLHRNDGRKRTGPDKGG